MIRGRLLDADSNAMEVFSGSRLLLGAVGGSVLAFVNVRWACFFSGAEGAVDALSPPRLLEIPWGPRGNPEPVLASGSLCLDTCKVFISLVEVFARSLRVGG